MKKESDCKNYLFLIFFIVGIFLFFISFSSAALEMVSPSNGTNFTTTLFFNATFVNGSDINVTTQTPGMTDINVSFYRVDGTTVTLIGNSSICTISAVASVERNVTCSGNITITSSIDGLYNISARLFNNTNGNVLNSSLVNTTRIRFDSTSPAVNATNFTALVNGQNKSSTLSLNVSISDQGIGIQTVYFNITNSSGGQNLSITANNFGVYWNATITTSQFPDGVYNVTVYVNDTLNNLNNSARVFSLRFDNTVPNVGASNFTALVDGQNKSSTLSLNVSLSDITTSIDAVYFNITNSTGGQNLSITANNFGVNWNATITTSQFPDGVYNITVFVNDTAGNLNSSARVFSIRLDNTVPNLAEANFSSPLTGRNYSERSPGILILNVSLSDITTSIGAVYFNVTNSSGGQNTTISATNSAGNQWNATLNTTYFPDGKYNITVYANDTAGNLNSSARVNSLILDNTVPNVGASNFTALVNGQNKSSTLSLNVSLSDITTSIDAVYFNITNSSGGQNFSITANNFGVNWNATVTTSQFPDGIYNVTVYVNDTAGNLNSSARVFSLRFDNTVPSITLTRQTSSSQTSLNLSISIVDATAGISSLCTSSRTAAVVSESGLSQRFIESGLGCGYSYSYLATCTDTAGNVGTKTSSFSTDDCPGYGAGSGVSGNSVISPSKTVTWKKTTPVTTEQVSGSEGKEVTLAPQERISVPVSVTSSNNQQTTETHHVGVVSLDSTKQEVSIEISSTPQKITLKVGESKNVEVTDDNYYDLKVTLLNILNNKANINVIAIHEALPVAEQPDDGTSQEGETDESGEEIPAEEKESSSGIWKKVIIILLVLLALLAVFYFVRKNNQ